MSIRVNPQPDNVRALETELTVSLSAVLIFNVNFKHFHHLERSHFRSSKPHSGTL